LRTSQEDQEGELLSLIPATSARWLFVKTYAVLFRKYVNADIKHNLLFPFFVICRILIPKDSQVCFLHKHHRVAAIAVFRHTVASYCLSIAVAFNFLPGLVRSRNEESECVFID
jgi:hypothetical protein